MYQRTHAICFFFFSSLLVEPIQGYPYNHVILTPLHSVFSNGRERRNVRATPPVTITHSLGITDDWCQGGRTRGGEDPEKTLGARAGSAPSYWCDLHKSSNPRAEGGVLHGNGAWHLEGAREKVQTPTPGSAW